MIPPGGLLLGQWSGPCISHMPHLVRLHDLIVPCGLMRWHMWAGKVGPLCPPLGAVRHRDSSEVLAKCQSGRDTSTGEEVQREPEPPEVALARSQSGTSRQLKQRPWRRLSFWMLMERMGTGNIFCLSCRRLFDGGQLSWWFHSINFDRI